MLAGGLAGCSSGSVLLGEQTARASLPAGAPATFKSSLRFLSACTRLLRDVDDADDDDDARNVCLAAGVWRAVNSIFFFVFIFVFVKLYSQRVSVFPRLFIYILCACVFS